MVQERITPEVILRALDRWRGRPTRVCKPLHRAALKVIHKALSDEVHPLPLVRVRGRYGTLGMTVVATVDCTSLGSGRWRHEHTYGDDELREIVRSGTIRLGWGITVSDHEREIALDNAETEVEA